MAGAGAGTGRHPAGWGRCHGRMVFATVRGGAGNAGRGGGGAGADYKSLAHDEKVQALSKIKYRNSLREAIYQLADELTER